MRNATFCLLVVLLGSWSSSVGQSAPKFTSPRIVATFERLGQTAEILPTTIYKHWGTFRISVVMVLTASNGNGASWDGLISYTDGSGLSVPEDRLFTGFRNTAPVEFPFRQGAGIPIRVSVQADGDTSGSRYNVWVVVEQLM